MSRDLGRQVVDQMTKEIGGILKEDHHGLLDGLLERINYRFMACLKKQQRKMLTNVSKRIFDKSEKGMELRKALFEKISTKINVKQEMLPKFLQKMLDSHLISSQLRPSYDAYFTHQIPKLIRQNLLCALATDNNKKQFYTYDHQSKRIKLEDDMRQITQNLMTRHGLKLHSPSVDTVIRLVEYLFRKYSKIVPESRYQLAVCLQQNYADAATIGAVFVGLLDHSDTYLGISDQQHFQMLHKALELIDAESLNLLVQAKNKDFKKIMKIFRQFIESLSCSMLNLQCSTYIIDQLLMKIKNKFDIYLIFSMVVALMTADGVEEQPIPNHQVKSADNGKNREAIKMEQDLFKLFQDRAFEIELPMLIKIFKQVYEGVKLYESPFAQISNQEVAYHSRPLKECAVQKYLEECQPQIAKIHGKAARQQAARNVKNNQSQQPKKHFGLIAPDINLDY